MAFDYTKKLTNPVDYPTVPQDEQHARQQFQDLFDEIKDAHNEHSADGTQHAKVARYTIGTTQSGWTAKDCDYICNGTNDHEKIIAALAALPATGGEVIILDGTYNIGASINVPKNNVSIRGNGNATILKRMYDSTDTDSGATAKGLITLNEKSGCKIQNIQIDGNNDVYSSTYNRSICLYDNSNNNTITGNTCNNTNNGIWLYTSSDNNITGNTCSNNTNYGIYLQSSSNNNTITGNTCNNNTSRGIRMDTSSDNAITGNTCNSNSEYGIVLYTSNSNNTITGNTCNNNTNYGIWLYKNNNDNNTITGNTCSNNTNGIRLHSTFNNYNCIVGNNLSGNTIGYVSGGGTGNLEANNVIKNK